MCGMLSLPSISTSGEAFAVRVEAGGESKISKVAESLDSLHLYFELYTF